MFIMTSISITKLYDLLSSKLGKETAEGLTTFMDERIKEVSTQNIKNLANKEDLLDVKTGLKIEITNTRADLIKWMFIFWIGQLLAMFSFTLLFMKK